MTHQIHPFSETLAFAVRLVSGAAVRWVDCEPSLKQRIYFANHTSHLDTVVIWAALPTEVRLRTRPVGARDYWTKGAVRRYVATKVFKAVLIDRRTEATAEPSLASARQTIDNTIEAMGDKTSIIIFPEGTRGQGEDISPFKSGIYYLALRRPDLELVPVYVENLNRILPKGEFFPVPVLSGVTFGAPLTLGDGEQKKDFLVRAREAIVALKCNE